MPEVWYDSARFYRRFSFRFGDCSSNKTASIFSIMKLFSEMAGEDYEGKGLDHTTLWEHGQAFLLSRMAIRFKRFPVFREATVASTWERFAKGAFFYRDFLIRTESGEELVSATSQWFIVNPLTREVLRPEMLFGGMQTGNPTAADNLECHRIKKRDDMPVLGLRPVWHSDIDGNGHVNNAAYGKIADDFLPEQCREKVKELYIEFKSEAKLGEIMEIRGDYTDSGFDVQGITDGLMHFGAEFVF